MINVLARLPAAASGLNRLAGPGPGRARGCTDWRPGPSLARLQRRPHVRACVEHPRALDNVNPQYKTLCTGECMYRHAPVNRQYIPLDSVCQHTTRAVCWRPAHTHTHTQVLATCARALVGYIPLDSVYPTVRWRRRNPTSVRARVHAVQRTIGYILSRGIYCLYTGVYIYQYMHSPVYRVLY
jgi:hypothetical protein